MKIIFSIIVLFVLLSSTEVMHSQEPLVSEIKMFAGNFAPKGWMFCDGRLLVISQYSTLYSIIGTTYGGDGRTTMALPDLRGRAPIHAGEQGKVQVLPLLNLGRKGGVRG